MKKIGIITYFHNSRNYGGVLQAYALTNFLRKNGVDAEQILFDNGGKKKATCGILQYIRKNIKKVIGIFVRKKLNTRDSAFEKFAKTVPHSEKIYTSENISETTDIYDIFVTGSDQVWNVEWYSGAYFLDFVPSDKVKISYAASMPNTGMSEKYKTTVKKNLESFNAVSVREACTVDFLENLTGKRPLLAADPVLLLEKEDWDNVCSERITKQKYVFCYFLGDGKEERKIAEKFAKKMKLKIVTVPYLCYLNKTDFFFGDLRYYDISPKDFISLIKYAEYVITDSFHATVFSHIYKTKYYVVERNGFLTAQSMTSRITTFLELCGEKERYFDSSRMNSELMLALKDKKVGEYSGNLYALREHSVDFLKLYCMKG